MDNYGNIHHLHGAKHLKFELMSSQWMLSCAPCHDQDTTWLVLCISSIDNLSVKKAKKLNYAGHAMTLLEIMEMYLISIILSCHSIGWMRSL